MHGQRGDALITALRARLSAEDIERNSTLQSLERIADHLSFIDNRRDDIDTILDIGCGSGAFVAALGEVLDVSTVMGIDRDKTACDAATARDVDAITLDIEESGVPLASDSVDLVICFGVLEHLRYYDNLLTEVHRILDGGVFWVATPNLGGWNNRLALLAGHQPRNVEVSSERAVGTLGMYDPNEFLDHVHAPTLGALTELLTHHDYEIAAVAGLRPYQRSSLVSLLDVTLGWRTSWARRVALIATVAPSQE